MPSSNGSDQFSDGWCPFIHESDSEDGNSSRTLCPVVDLLRIRFSTPNPRFTLPFQKPPIHPPSPLICNTAVPTPEVISLLDPPIPTLPETDVNSMDFFLKTPSRWVKLTLSEVRRFILFPHLVSPPYQEILMVGRDGGEMAPALLPHLTTLKAMCPVLGTFVTWWMEKAQFSSLPWIAPPLLSFVMDPAPILPQIRNIYTLRESGMKLILGEVTNSLVIMGFRQMEIKANCLFDVKLEQGVMEVTFSPRNQFLHSVVEGKFVAVGTSTVQETRKELFLQNFLPEPMIVISWNARGIARKGFISNVLHLISEHSPDLLFISETKTSRAHTEKIIKALPFDSYHLAEPRGF